MSTAAFQWAMSQDVARSSSRLLLVTMAWFVPEGGDEMFCAASYAEIARASRLNEKTVVDGVLALREAGHISQTNLRAGATGKVVVYRLNAPKNGAISSGPEGEGGTQPQHANAPENGCIKPESNAPVFTANAPKNGGNTPENGGQSPQKRSDIPPNLGALASLSLTSSTSTEEAEGKKRNKGKRSGEGDAAKPADVTEQTWADWTSLRRKKRATVSATVIEEARGEAGKAGLTLERFLRIWCLRGSQGLQADWLKPSERGRPTAPNRHGDFRERDYSEGLTDGIPNA